VIYDGTVRLFATVVVEIICTFDFQWVPYDHQTCPIIFNVPSIMGLNRLAFRTLDEEERHEDQTGEALADPQLLTAASTARWLQTAAAAWLQLPWPLLLGCCSGSWHSQQLSLTGSTLGLSLQERKMGAYKPKTVGTSTWKYLSMYYDFLGEYHLPPVRRRDPNRRPNVPCRLLSVGLQSMSTTADLAVPPAL